MEDDILAEVTAIPDALGDGDGGGGGGGGDDGGWDFDLNWSNRSVRCRKTSEHFRLPSGSDRVNFSACGFNWTGNNASFTIYGGDDDGGRRGPLTSTPEQNFWTLCLLLFPLLTVFGNVLVVLSVYREKALQTVTNYFIVSLAIADIMVAILVMPLSVYVEVRFFSTEFNLLS